MEIPKTSEMQAAVYSPHHLAKIFEEIKPPTMANWFKADIVKPAVPAEGAGFPARYSYLNLIEVGLVAILVARGINSHNYLKALLKSGAHESGTSLAEKMRSFAFNRYLILPGGMRVQVLEGKEINEDDLHPLYFLRAPEELQKLSEASGIPDWFAVNVGLLKKYVDSKLQEL